MYSLLSGNIAREKGEQVVMPRLKIKERNDPLYVKKTTREAVYLELSHAEALQKAAERNGCGITVVMFQALHDYCIKQAETLPDGAVEAILRGEPWRGSRA